VVPKGEILPGGYPGVALALALLGACGYFSNWITEHRSPTISATGFHTIALLLGTTDQTSAALADKVEQRLGAGGWVVVPRPGRWRNEAEALDEICQAAPSSTVVDGVLFVWPDQLKLWDCRTHLAAYEARSERAGPDELLNRLVQYLRGQPPRR
jgi:hypothetical protein